MYVFLSLVASSTTRVNKPKQFSTMDGNIQNNYGTGNTRGNYILLCVN